MAVNSESGPSGVGPSTPSPQKTDYKLVWHPTSPEQIGKNFTGDRQSSKVHGENSHGLSVPSCEQRRVVTCSTSFESCPARDLFERTRELVLQHGMVSLNPQQREELLGSILQVDLCTAQSGSCEKCRKQLNTGTRIRRVSADILPTNLTPEVLFTDSSDEGENNGVDTAESNSWGAAGADRRVRESLKPLKGFLIKEKILKR